MCIATLYAPSYFKYYLKWYIENEKIYYQSELMLLLILNLYLILNYNIK